MIVVKLDPLLLRDSTMAELDAALQRVHDARVRDFAALEARLLEMMVC